MEIETVRMSSKGQVVIPHEIRDRLEAKEGTVFAVIGSRDAIVLKKVGTPSKADLLRALDRIATEGKKRLQNLGVKESDIPKIVRKRRKS